MRVVDWDNPLANDFLLVSQMTITGDLYTCRPDLIGFVNGLPFVVIELKKPGVPAKQAFDENLTSYKHLQNGIPALFWYNAFMIASNGSDSRVGSLTADWERFTEWKRIEREDEPRRVSLEVMLRGLCEPTRLLDFVENFTLFSEHKSGLVKAIAQNHQYLGVNNAIRATLGGAGGGTRARRCFLADAGIGQELCDGLLRAEDSAQGAGQLDLRDRDRPRRAGRADRQDVCRLRRGERCQCLSRRDWRGAARASGGQQPLRVHPHSQVSDAGVLCDRRDVIVLTDEAHRTQYDTLALNMRSALPNALFLAFTGTPLIAGEERTREVFGDYVSIYDFQQSVEDGATVPLFYENRTPELHLDNPNLNDDIYDLIEDAELVGRSAKRSWSASWDGSIT